MLFVDATKTDAVLFSDTLACVGDKPTLFHEKVRTLHDKNMTVAGLGSTGLFDLWHQYLASTTGLGDIETITAHAPEVLRSFYADLSHRTGVAGLATIYHFGFPTGSSKIAMYALRSSRNFEAEKMKPSRFYLKPALPGFKFRRPRNIDEAIDLAIRVRDANDQDPAGVHIGGDLFATIIQNWRTTTMRLHRFDDFDDDWQAMGGERIAFIRSS